MRRLQDNKNLKGKKYARLRRKRIWPSVIIFVVFLFLSCALITAVVGGFCGFIISNKMNLLTEQANQTGLQIAQRVAYGMSMEEALTDQRKDVIDPTMRHRSQVYVTDMKGNYVASTGKDAPDPDALWLIDLGNEYQVYGDADQELQDSVALEERLTLSVQEILQWCFMGDPTEYKNEREWFQATATSTRFWLLADTGTMMDLKYRVYVASELQLQRSDMIYLFAGGVMMLLLFVVLLFILLANAISVAKTQKRMTKILFTDPVTDGNNWPYFQTYATRRLQKYRNAKKPYALVKLRLERYQNFCACYGVDEGEELLEHIYRFLKARIGMTDLFARYGEADFGLLLTCEGLTEENFEVNLNRRMRTLMAELTGLKPEYKIHFHAGVVFIPPAEVEATKSLFSFLGKGREQVDIDQMYNYAGSALEETHCNDGCQIGFFNEKLLEDQAWEHFVESHMEEALDKEEFEVYIQPKYNPIDGRLVGAEALARWRHPEKGLIPPGRFIPIFEENGFITKLDDYMISHVAKLQAQWTIKKVKQVPVSVNVSRAHFSQEGLAEHICQLVDAYGPRHELIELEVTESAFFDDKDILIRTVKELKSYGFPVSMDDFGAGYSSLNSLKDIPLDVLKLDGEFFRGDDEDGRGAVVVQEAIRLARGLHMRVVAEGIEREDQVKFLAKEGCDMIQGFYFAKPMPVEDFEKQVERDA